MRPPGARSAAFVAWLPSVLGASGCASGIDGLLESATCTRPLIAHARITQNTTNVLSVFVTANVQQADSVAVRFGVNAATDSATPTFATSGDSAFVPVLGLLPSTTYEAQ